MAKRSGSTRRREDDSFLTRTVDSVFRFVRFAEFEILFVLFFVIAFIMFKDLVSPLFLSFYLLSLLAQRYMSCPTNIEVVVSSHVNCMLCFVYAFYLLSLLAQRYMSCLTKIEVVGSSHVNCMVCVAYAFYLSLLLAQRYMSWPTNIEVVGSSHMVCVVYDFIVYETFNSLLLYVSDKWPLSYNNNAGYRRSDTYADWKFSTHSRNFWTTIYTIVFVYVFSNLCSLF